MIRSIDRIKRFTAGMDLPTFAGNEQVVDAVKYGLVIISEAAAKLGDAALDLCPDIPWRDVRGLGNRLRHEYDTIDVVRIWLLIEKDLPDLRSACERAVRTLTQDTPSG